MTEVNETIITEGLEVKSSPATPSPQGKTFSEDYVHTLREENKSYRLQKTASDEQAAKFGATLREILGLGADDTVDDARITAYRAKIQQDIDAANNKSNEKLIKAEIKSLDGYNTKLVDALLDKSKLEFGEDGEIKGLKEAVKALEVEYPEIKLQKAASGVNPPPTNITTASDKYNELKNQVRKHPNDKSLMQKLFKAKANL